MVTLEQIPESIRNRKLQWGQIRDKFIKDTQPDEDYYYQDVEHTRTNFTAKQLENIKDKTDIPLSIAYSYSITNDKLALLTNHDPSHKVISTHMNDKTADQVALRLDEMKHSVMRDSLASNENEEVIKNYLCRGLGIGGIKRPEFYYEGEIPLRYINIHPGECILDANCYSLNAQDMEGYFLEAVLTKQRAKQYYTPLIEKIRAKAEIDPKLSAAKNLTIDFFVNSTSYSTNEQTRLQANYDEGTVETTEYIDKVYAEMYVVKDKNGKLDFLFVENFDSPDETIALMGDNVVDKIPGLYVRSTLMLGQYAVMMEIHPYTLYELDILTFERRSRKSFYESYGLMHYLKSMQEAFDKTMATMILNGILINNAGYKGPKGSFTNPEDWKQYGDPTILKEYTITNIEGKIFVPEREEVGQLSPYFPMLLQMIERAMKSVSAINDIMQGNPDANVDVFSSLQQYQNAAMERIKRDSKRINIFSTNIGRILVEQLIITIEPDIIYAFEKGDEYGQVTFPKDFVNLIRTVKFRVIPVPSDAMPSQKLTIASEIMKVAQSSSNETEREIFMHGSLKLAGIRAIDEMLDQLDTAKRLQSQIQQMQDELDRGKELNKQYENRAINSEHDRKVMELVVRTALSIAKAEGKAQGEISGFKEIAELQAKLKTKNSVDES